jgi:hypothetical protein
MKCSSIDQYVKTQSANGTCTFNGSSVKEFYELLQLKLKITPSI